MQTCFSAAATQQAGSLVRACVAALAVLATTTAASAADRTAVLIEAGDQRLRDDLQWLSDRGVVDLSTAMWPLPLSVVEQALAARRPGDLPMADALALAAVQRKVADLRQPLSVALGARFDSEAAPAWGFDAPLRARSEVGAELQLVSGAVAGRLQVARLQQPLTPRQSATSLQGSYLATELGGQLLYAGQLAHWWGPGQDGSLIWSNAGTAIPGVGLRRERERAFESRWLSWMGPWNYELFLGQQQHTVGLPRTRIAGMRFEFRPSPGFTVGASRLIQWGGAVGDSGWGALAQAAFGRTNYDSDGGPVTNEIAGFDMRYTLALGGNPLTLYGQLIGEDQANKLTMPPPLVVGDVVHRIRATEVLGKVPWTLVSQLGAQYQHAWDGTRLRWHVEAADTVCQRFGGQNTAAIGVAYNHSFYNDGMYQDGLPIGHFLGGDGRAASFGLTVMPEGSASDLRINARLMRAEVNASNQTNNLAFPARDWLSAGRLSASWIVRAGALPVELQAGLSASRSQRDGQQAGVQFGIKVALENLAR